MQSFQPVLLKVWREACRDIEIGRAAADIARLLTGDLPLARLLIRRVDIRRKCLETVAEEVFLSGAAPGNAWTECDETQWIALCDFGRIGRVVRLGPAGDHAGGDFDLSFTYSEAPGGEVLVGPLRREDSLTGLLLLVAKPAEPFSQRHEDLATVLLDPFSLALENDRRLGELAAQREAAEADRRSLLSRLGRKEIGDTIVGANEGLAGVLDRVELVARSDAPVLIFGETGTGKELIARAIHQRSPRAAGPIHRVNCGAIPPELIDAELFGHERGAFTGAEQQRKGWFERANNGTLFLDEIGELPLAAQVRLLRILQDGWLERVGGQHPVHVDVRIVAATHCDLARMVAEGRFREDLWYRMAVFPIVLPPLRERRSDIPELARHFARRAAVRFGLPEVLPTDDDLRLLCAYDWPGNVRELGTVIDRAAILGNGGSLEMAKALGGGETAVTRSPQPATSGHSPVGPATSAHIEPLDTAIRRHIERALAAARGKVEGPRGAAEMLSVNPHTLRSKMRKLGIDWRGFREL